MSRPPTDPRTAALRRFAASITALTLVGAIFLGFEDSWAQPMLALTVAYGVELLLATLESWASGTPPRYRGGPVAFIDYLLPAHITALSIALLLYPGDWLAPVGFAVTVAVASKFLLRVPVNGKPRHFLNPSNFAISVTLIAFPSVGIAPPYSFTENAAPLVAWGVPLGVLAAGTMLNARLTGKGPLIAGWLGGFVAQALLRAAVFGTPVLAPVLPLTGVVLILYTNYMITDPGTTPVRPRNQIAFGLGTAVVYGLLVSAHVVFGLFFALTIVCCVRGAALAVLAVRPSIAAPAWLRSRAKHVQQVVSG